VCSRLDHISPAEIEDVLLAHPAVADVVCFGVKSERCGEEVAAAVVLSGEADEQLLKAHCRERLAAVGVPRTIHILPQVPRTPTGKVQRRRVAEGELMRDVRRRRAF
jgi:acyl-CoA synthetase (AMP-forming)/AMP-acid ligase II